MKQFPQIALKEIQKQSNFIAFHFIIIKRDPNKAFSCSLVLYLLMSVGLSGCPKRKDIPENASFSKGGRIRQQESIDNYVKYA